ncbi:NAD(P)/FAD-dependent oxidoreductase [Pseudochrobactrum algeriensis]|uniref:NAD(P)/FAD-dependent oxidoreductase n=1 Tax=Pseudochrobactrum TaxID=354349 RepID=UPI001BCF7162|nr:MULTISPECIES: FAD/NAD(P)-binding oxidoreductase [Pseudochrobactrum]MDM8347210.1 FAD/NAD(P)-binding oxidoreductase [Pseudochrobactrum sp. sp1633]QVQ36627.1 NAD(P)/FAD-dependent oxidoreductase [Pseudochrobactrum algeriensis]QVQ39842.1 NAD(P)/FAD-dependent oxidoreductase [Pseudochrobactrum algeriensis]QVQ43764.1 NAD(P)/FAD-dependent oxidoreductase [Pseudochrobactrum algeriensis]
MERRQFLVGAAALASVGLSTEAAQAQTSNSRARIVIAGAGAAGLALASRLRRAMPNATVTIIDAKKEHHFQPGFTLVGAGIWSPAQVTERNVDYMPRGVEWVEAAVAEFDPEANAVVTTTGQRIDYDFLMVATGLKLNYEAIEGMDVSLIGRDGIASIYAGPEQARASAAVIDGFIDAGGVGLFGRPAGEMKCAGAPLKITFITDDKARSRGRRGSVELIYNAHNPAVFSVVPVNDRVAEMFAGRDIAVNYSHVLKAIDPGAKQATYATESGDITLDYDFIHVVPPMRAPDAVLASPLPWQDGALAADGWIEADRATLRHPRYPNVFAVGDIAGVPRGKTAASVKWQVPVVVDNLVAETAGRTPQAVYNGYTSCPMVTGIGKAMLIEFDYDGNLIPSFPFIDPLKELWVSWLIEEKGLLGAYRAMLRGRA